MAPLVRVPPRMLEMQMVNWRVYAPIALALFIAGYAAGTCGKPSSAELEAAETAREEAVALADEAERARAAVELQAGAEIAEAQAQREAALTVARAAADRRPTIIERVVERAGADSAVVRVAVQEVADSIVSYEVTPLRAALAAADSAGAAQGRLLAAERAARLAAQEGLRAALVEIELLRDDRPSWLARNWWKVAIPAAAYAGWEARARLRAPAPTP